MALKTPVETTKAKKYKTGKKPSPTETPFKKFWFHDFLRVSVVDGFSGFLVFVRAPNAQKVS
jgi:hypothetical protein